ncbi:MAG: radical SAM protein, partial [Planctomycetia bacterium]|nr:radical SAM protein [Planctomycetia bacterium]
MATIVSQQRFIVEIIKPSHYDDDGYVIQWVRAFVPSNSLACLYGLVDDVKRRQGLGADVEVVVNAYEECHTVIHTRKIIQRIHANGGRGIVFLAGVQSNQFPRAAEMAREFRAAGIQVAVGGFHVSGCLAMLPELPADIRAVEELGVTLFAGEAEGRMEEFLQDAYHQRLKPRYNYMLDLPNLQGQVTPLLPRDVSRRYMYFTPFDAGRGCPFQCSFCTIINVQGRTSRYRDADDVEKLVRGIAAEGVRRVFITDDNMARNKNWEAIFDRLIELDTMCHKIPNFIDKATRAGCNRVFIGLENINPENLRAAKKFQNKITEYRLMLQAWRARGVITYAGYILGMPSDTPESIERDIRIIQQELPIDILEFMILTPLPGSADHKAMLLNGEWMDEDMNKFDLEHVTMNHRNMTAEQWQAIYDRAWYLYYTPQHIETL